MYCCWIYWRLTKSMRIMNKILCTKYRWPFFIFPQVNPRFIYFEVASQIRTMYLNQFVGAFWKIIFITPLWHFLLVWINHILINPGHHGRLLPDIHNTQATERLLQIGHQHNVHVGQGEVGAQDVVYQVEVVGQTRNVVRKLGACQWNYIEFNEEVFFITILFVGT